LLAELASSRQDGASHPCKNRSRHLAREIRFKTAVATRYYDQKEAAFKPRKSQKQLPPHWEFGEGFDRSCNLNFVSRHLQLDGALRIGRAWQDRMT